MSGVCRHLLAISNHAAGGILMRSNLTNAHIRLLRAVRATIAADPWFAAWCPQAAASSDAGFDDFETGLHAGSSSAPTLVIEDFASEPWASLTFSGMRHSLAIRLHGPQLAVESAYDRLECLLTEPDLDIHGHFLADMELVESEGEIHPDGSMSLGIQFEALTIEE